MTPEERQQEIEQEEQLVREIIEASAKRPLDQDERACLYFHTGIRQEPRA